LPPQNSHSYEFFLYFFSVCGEHIKNSLSGSVSLKPLGGYDKSESCEWVIEFPQGKRISLSPKFFELENDGTACRFDKVEIRDGADSNAALMGVFCGSLTPPHLQSSEFWWI